MFISPLGERPAETGEWTPTALRVLAERYLAHSNERHESPEDMLWRVAATLAWAERAWVQDEQALRRVAEAFYRLMVRREFMPNSPTLMNAGRANGLQYSACYVLPVEDSIEGIFETVKRAAVIHQSGGGTGFAFSRLRASDCPVRSTGGRASGPVTFMHVFDAATEAVKQGGTRRGANMAVLRVDHPDIVTFIDCKREGRLTNFNISVAVTDPFMAALERGSDYALHDHAGRAVGSLQAREVWDRIVSAAWRTGDPGLVFIDRINRSRANPTPAVSLIEATNPCGEQPLAPNEACNLGSLNLTRFLAEDSFDWPRLDEAVALSTRFLDDVIECNPYPLPEIDAMVKANRRVGLGIMGWADCLMALRIPYDSEAAITLAEQVMGRIEKAAEQATRELGAQRGGYPNQPHGIHANEPPRRNATVTTIAPTGTISIIAGCSSGIEPAFALAFRHVVGDRVLQFVNPVVEAALADAAPEVLERLRARGTLQDESRVAPEARRAFVTAHEIAPAWHVRMQAAFQRYTENGVSKTVNLAADASVSDVSTAYQMAWDEGCLGITVFRDGCKGGQVLHHGADAAHLAPRPRKADGSTWRVASPLGTCFITVNRDERGEPLEVFANVGKAGSDISAVSEAIGRLVSLVLRLPSPLSPAERLREIVSQMREIGGARPIGLGPNRVRSLPDAIAQVLAEFAGVERGGSPSQTDRPSPSDFCPECGGATLVFEEGCASCKSCGYSYC
ncbi:MAG: adenosylcobalamin-dependent ribonucleoside-diphosphate reductase [Proteobacteria bacterium]|nr:adenosylcobalamin-dependent ribonucleoside-diphosphate reductase [Pseudomonadota bacterium]